MASTRTEYILKRKQLTREIINLGVDLIECEFLQLERIPLFDFKEVKILLSKMVKEAKTKPEMYA